MRDPDRIPEVLNRIKVVWMTQPDMRLMQLIGNLSPVDLYYMEDDQLVKELEELYFKELAKAKKES